ncbi:hypothetical protein J1P26_17115 [Neobacillus sp. MM2021_6]|uniref:hypothetical protein n=1 Tax=Bacillaceae TaxID=186817 RepID=UPI00140D6E61|nr:MULTISPECIES: hypothetical protein [Bacillaceae]MBO0961428.1 hypothetical protein [Neobacillus sp. MM2021_6]NHC19532.1 hypothetical protein [Bacillus sp. MM2020_4]
MKKALKIILGMFVAFFIIVAIILVVDISNDVEYKVIEKKESSDSIRLKVETEATKEGDLKTIVDEVKKESKNVDAVWLWIYKPGKNGELLAKAKIPYNNKGQVMVGANDLNYIFEKE